MLYVIKSLHTATCGNPFHGIDSDAIIMIMNYTDPAIEGTIVTYGCPFEYVFNTATCMESGEWEPDPKKVECKGMNS